VVSNDEGSPHADRRPFAFPVEAELSGIHADGRADAVALHQRADGLSGPAYASYQSPRANRAVRPSKPPFLLGFVLEQLKRFVLSPFDLVRRQTVRDGQKDRVVRNVLVHLAVVPARRELMR
jgi:hypothetical protein